MALKTPTLRVDRKQLKCPPLEEVATVLSKGLQDVFSHVSVEVVDCPDLTQQPFTLARQGLGGKTALVESGGVPFLLPLVNREKLYEMQDFGKLTGLESFLIIGAGAGPWPHAGTNCELMANLSVDGNKVDNQSRIAKVDPKDKSCLLETLPEKETRHALLGNLFCTEGKPGKVLKVHCRHRIGEDDFVTSLRKALASHYKNEAVGLGGTFLLKEGKARQHVMPDFSLTPLHTEEDLSKWLRFFNMSAPLIAVGTLISADPGLDLRVQHFHSFSHHGEGGHYHNDTTPNTAEYLGYFNLGESVIRVDAPIETHHIGRD
ncbi:ester hydrolase C11orf54 homolog [Frankliniella occidentalis]|uniref:Ester hydrolase C11orf54 homolog n=1 Tax=Frankliniella occidentalis TaxID=133901 RepID=A0A6J1TED1_FRAOC|nr:ester hydrolase C11orf54 homolog [Frankliniella occidentalis]